jgi:hypothetical protein
MSTTAASASEIAALLGLAYNIGRGGERSEVGSSRNWGSPVLTQAGAGGPRDQQRLWGCCAARGVCRTREKDTML